MSSRVPEPLREAEERVAASRRRVERRVSQMRQALHDDFALVPRTTAWVLPALGLAIGFGLALRAFGRRRARRD